MKNNMKIGIIDSGIGGLTILKEVRDLLPRENILYYGDFINNPYAKKSQDEIFKLSHEIVKFMVRNHCKVIIVACSLFSAAVLERLQKLFHIPIIGTIEAGVKAALVETQNNSIGLIGSEFTVKSNAYHTTFKEHSDDISLFQLPCDDIGGLIEEGWSESEENLNLLEGYINQLPKDIDTLILGGTHYPIIKHNIKLFFNKNIVDSSREIVIELLDILIKENILSDKSSKGSLEFCVTGDYSVLEKNLPTYLKREKNYNIYSLI